MKQISFQTIFLLIASLVAGNKLCLSQPETPTQKFHTTNNDGMHVFAVAFYSLMKQENFPQNKESIRGFIVRMINTGKLLAGKIKLIYDVFFGQKNL